MKARRILSTSGLDWARKHLDGEDLERVEREVAEAGAELADDGPWVRETALNRAIGVSETDFEPQPESPEIGVADRVVSASPGVSSGPSSVLVPTFEVVGSNLGREAQVAAIRLVERAIVDLRAAARSPFADAETRDALVQAQAWAEIGLKRIGGGA